MLNTLNIEIQHSLQAKKDVTDDLNKVIKNVQSKCKHEIVAEVPYDSIGSATRICLHCRIIEEGSHWSGGSTWSEKDFNVAILGNSDNRVITPISRNKYYDLRL